MRRTSAHTVAALSLLLAACSGGGSSAERESSPDASVTAAEGGEHDATSAEATAHDTGAPPTEAAADAPADAPGDATDAGPECAPFGAPGQCITVSACAALGNHSSYAGYCPGPASIECCIVTPNVADNPPVPAGWQLMQQSQVTAAMTSWAVSILNDPTDYPMFSTTTQVFGALDVLARVEWHPPDFNNSVVHRGVTLYEPIDGG